MVTPVELLARYRAVAAFGDPDTLSVDGQSERQFAESVQYEIESQHTDRKLP